MLDLYISSRGQITVHRAQTGLITIGRDAKANSIHVDDDTVSRIQFGVEDLNDGRVRISNHSKRQPIFFALEDESSIDPGADREAELPIECLVGNSVFTIDVAAPWEEFVSKDEWAQISATLATIEQIHQQLSSARTLLRQQTEPLVNRIAKDRKLSRGNPAYTTVALVDQLYHRIPEVSGSIESRHEFVQQIAQLIRDLLGEFSISRRQYSAEERSSSPAADSPQPARPLGKYDISQEDLDEFGTDLEAENPTKYSVVLLRSAGLSLRTIAMAFGLASTTTIEHHMKSARTLIDGWKNGSQG